MRTLKHPSYTYRKGDVYYFLKAIPRDLASFYAKPRIIKLLKTECASHAKTASRSLSSRLEDYLVGLRRQQAEVPASHLLVVQPDSIYKWQHSNNSDLHFQRAAMRRVKPLKSLLLSECLRITLYSPLNLKRYGGFLIGLRLGLQHTF